MSKRFMARSSHDRMTASSFRIPNGNTEFQSRLKRSNHRLLARELAGTSINFRLPFRGDRLQAGAVAGRPLTRALYPTVMRSGTDRATG